MKDIGLLLLRIGFGGIMALAHGLGKLQNYSQLSTAFPDPLGVGASLSATLAVGAEFFCAILVALGIATRLAAIPLIITMFVAAVMVHGADPFQKKELAVLYLIAYTAIACLGGGKYSLGKYLPKLSKFN